LPEVSPFLMVNVLIAIASSAGGGVPNTDPQIPLAAADGPDEHAVAPSPNAPTKATPISIRPCNPPLPIAISWHIGHPPGSAGAVLPTRIKRQAQYGRLMWSRRKKVVVCLVVAVVVIAFFVVVGFTGERWCNVGSYCHAGNGR